MTLKATIRRHGDFKTHHLNFDIGKKLIEGIKPLWTRYFNGIRTNIHSNFRTNFPINIDKLIPISGLESRLMEVTGRVHENLAKVLKAEGVSSCDSYGSGSFTQYENN